MSGEAFGWTVKHSPYKGVGYTLHLVLADVVNDAHGQRFWMSTSGLAGKARTSRETASRWLWQAVEDGYLAVVTDRRGQVNTSSEFRFLMPPDTPQVWDPQADPRDNVTSARRAPRDKQSHGNPRDELSHGVTSNHAARDELSPELKRELKRELKQGQLLGSEPAAPTPKKATKPHPMPDDLELTDAMRRAASEVHLPTSQHDVEFANFCDHHRAKGSKMADWSLAWRKWARTAVKFAEKHGSKKVAPAAGPSKYQAERDAAAAAVKARRARERGEVLEVQPVEEGTLWPR